MIEFLEIARKLKVPNKSNIMHKYMIFVLIKFFIMYIKINDGTILIYIKYSLCRIILGSKKII